MGCGKYFLDEEATDEEEDGRNIYSKCECKFCPDCKAKIQEKK